MALLKHETMSKPRNTDEDSYADDLRATWASMTDGESSDAEPEEASTPLQPKAAPPKEAPEPDPEVDTSPPDGSQESQYGDPETAPSIEPEVEARKAEAKAAEQQVQAPEFWTSEDKAKFAALPDDTIRQTVLDWRTQIEKGAQEKFEAAAEARKFHDEVGRILAPFDGELQNAGLTRVDGIKRLVNAERLLRQNPQQGLQWLLDQYGQGQFAVVRRDAQPTAAQPAQQQTGNGNVNELVAQIVDQRFQAIQAAEEQRQNAAVLQAAQETLQQFTDAKGEDGQPKYPHFEEVKVQMAALIQSGAASGLEEAYEQAIWTRPALRERLTKAQQESAAKSVADAQRQAVAKAKAARTPKTASTSVPVADEDEDLPQQELLKKVWRQQATGLRV